MSLAGKLQIKPGTRVALLRRPADVDLGIEPGAQVANPANADAVVVFVTTAEDLSMPEVRAFVSAARRGAVAWVAYPKAGQLGTDLNRDSLAALIKEQGVRPVRQVSVDSTWSALRFRPAG